MIILLQCLAARLAGIDQLLFHTVSLDGRAPYQKAISILQNDLFPQSFMQRLFRAPPRERKASDLIAQIDRMNFQWGEGDGN